MAIFKLLLAFENVKELFGSRFMYDISIVDLWHSSDGSLLAIAGAIL